MKVKSPFRRTTIYLNHNHMKQLGKVSKALGLSPAASVRLAVSEFLTNRTPASK